jgi:deoxycytidylate deaminase
MQTPHNLLRMHRLTPEGSGPCIKQTVTATIVTPQGERYVATNHCLTPQPVCARAGLATGVGYDLCRSVCAQPAHAEVNAVNFAGKNAIGAVLYLEGHTYACDNCQRIAALAGVVEIRIEAPPLAP